MPHYEPIEVNLANLHLLAGEQAGAAADTLLARAVADLYDRGADLKVRTVELVVELVKVSADGDDITLRLKCKSKAPSYNTGKTTARLSRDAKTGKLVALFEPQSPRNPDQPNLFPRRRHPEAPADDEADAE